MTDAPERIWVQWPNPNSCGLAFTVPANPGLVDKGKATPRTSYILATPEALAPSPEVQALIAEAVAAERERCVEIAVRHWEGEPEDTIAMAAEMRAGMNPLTDYERKVAQMREDFPNGI